MVHSFEVTFSTNFKAALVAAVIALLPNVFAVEELIIRPVKLAIVSKKPLAPIAILSTVTVFSH